MQTRKKAGIDEKDFKFKHLRAKAATDLANSQGIDAAKTLLNHSDTKTTEIYVRNEKGVKVKPLK